jgi:mycofactocin precursor
VGFDTLRRMETDTATLVVEDERAVEDTDDLVVEELLIEEISIDGMCGVY